jgi:hypothetical protein
LLFYLKQYVHPITTQPAPNLVQGGSVRTTIPLFSRKINDFQIIFSKL